MADVRHVPWNQASGTVTDPVDAPPRSRQSPPAHAPAGGVDAIIDLVHRSTALLRAESERANTLEARSRIWLEQAQREVAEYRQRLEDAEVRIAAAEARARDAEEQLARIHQALTESLREAGVAGERSSFAA